MESWSGLEPKRNAITFDLECVVLLYAARELRITARLVRAWPGLSETEREQAASAISARCSFAAHEIGNLVELISRWGLNVECLN